MKIDDYQMKARETAIYNTKTDRIIYPALGLAGEAGEVANKVKKLLRDGVLDNDEISKEIGDCAWYLANLAEDLGLLLSDILKDNLDKLQSRKDREVLKGSGDNR